MSCDDTCKEQECVTPAIDDESSIHDRKCFVLLKTVGVYVVCYEMNN